MNSLQSTTGQEPLAGIHTSHIVGIAPEQICLPHCTYMSHCTATVIYKGPLLLHTSVKKRKCNFNLPCHNYICANNKYALKCQIYDICKNYLTGIYGATMPICMPLIELPPLMMKPKSLHTDKDARH